MRNVTLTKVGRAEFEVLQQELQSFAEIQRLGYNFWSIEDFLNAIIAVDVAHTLWVKLRNRLESEQKEFRITFKLNEAAIVMKCCFWQRDGRTPYQQRVAEKYKNILDNQLKNILPVAQQ